MPRVTDTKPEIEQMVRARIMAMAGASRMRMGADMFTAARRMVLASLPVGLPENELKRRLFERIYGVELPDGVVAARGGGEGGV
jgi:hypothetical protein